MPKGVILLNEKIVCVGYEKTMLKRCTAMSIAPPSCYTQENGKWYRTKAITEEQRQQRYTCFQLALLSSIRTILLWLLWLPIAAAILLLF